MAETRATASIPASTRVVAERLDLEEPPRRASGLLTSARADELSQLGRCFSEERTAVFARSIARKAARMVEQESALEMQLAAAEQPLDRLRGIVQALHDHRATADRGAASKHGCGRSSRSRAASRAMWSWTRCGLPSGTR
jgi:hypothetical protein